MHPVLAESISLCLDHVAQQRVIERATKPYPASVGWKSRSFATPEERVEYEVAFVGYPCKPLVHCEAAALGYHDAAKTAAWRAEHGGSAA